MSHKMCSVDYSVECHSNLYTSITGMTVKASNAVPLTPILENT